MIISDQKCRLHVSLNKGYLGKGCSSSGGRTVNKVKVEKVWTGGELTVHKGNLDLGNKRIF